MDAVTGSQGVQVGDGNIQVNRFSSGAQARPPMGIRRAERQPALALKL